MALETLDLLFDHSGAVHRALTEFARLPAQAEFQPTFAWGFVMPYSPISCFKASRRIAGVFVRARTSAAVMLAVFVAGNSVCAASSDDVDRMLGAVSEQAVKLRKCYERRLDFDRTLSCKTRSEIIKSAERGCWFAETDLRKAVMKSATPEQLSSIASLTAGVLDAVRRPVEDTVSDDAHREIPFDCLVEPISR